MSFIRRRALAASFLVAASTLTAPLSFASAASNESVTIPGYGTLSCSEVETRIGGHKVHRNDVHDFVIQKITELKGPFYASVIGEYVYRKAIDALDVCDLIASDEPVRTPVEQPHPQPVVPTVTVTPEPKPVPVDTHEPESSPSSVTSEPKTESDPSSATPEPEPAPEPVSPSKSAPVTTHESESAPSSVAHSHLVDPDKDRSDLPHPVDVPEPVSPSKPVPVDTHKPEPAPAPVEHSHLVDPDKDRSHLPHPADVPEPAPTPKPAPVDTHKPVTIKPAVTTGNTPAFGLTCQALYTKVGHTKLSESQIMSIAVQQGANHHVPSQMIMTLRPNIISKFKDCGLLAEPGRAPVVATPESGSSELFSSSSEIFAGSS